MNRDMVGFIAVYVALLIASWLLVLGLIVTVLWIVHHV